jgi:hypothetical protein
MMLSAGSKIDHIGSVRAMVSADRKMRETYELWDMETANLVGIYESMAAALEVVSRSLVAFGPAAIETLVLTAEDGKESRVIARAADLTARRATK